MEQDVEGSDDQRSTPSRLREAVERIKATPKPKSKLRIVEKVGVHIFLLEILDGPVDRALQSKQNLCIKPRRPS